MTYGKTIIISLFVGLFIGCLVTGFAGWYFIYRPTVSGLRGELDASRRDAQLYLDRATESERRVNDVTGIITESTTTISGTISTISDAKRKIREAIDTLRKIREVVEVKELDNGG